MFADHPWLNALCGGALIGLASLLAAAASGKIPGISGIFSRLLRPRLGPNAWRLVFLFGLLAGAALAIALLPAAPVYRPSRSLFAFALAGLLVGFGTRLSGGCTSGHGVCGLGLGSKSALAATLAFMAAGFVTVFLFHHTGLSALVR